MARTRLTKVPDDQDTRLHLATLLARMGLRDEALEEVERAREYGRKDGFTNFHIGVVHAVLGEPEEALAALVLAHSRGYYVRSEARNPEFDILRGMPEFQSLVQ